MEWNEVEWTAARSIEEFHSSNYAIVGYEFSPPAGQLHSNSINHLFSLSLINSFNEQEDKKRWLVSFLVKQWRSKAAVMEWKLLSWNGVVLR